MTSNRELTEAEGASLAGGSAALQAQAHPQTHWDEFARETATAAAHATFIAEEDEHWYGMARGFVHRAYPDIVRLVSMWVDPTRRRSGIGGALVDAVVQ